jgi:hypothetical protein
MSKPPPSDPPTVRAAPPLTERSKVLPFGPRIEPIPAEAWRIMKAIGRAAFGIRYRDDEDEP